MVGTDSLHGPLDPARDAGYTGAPPRMGFFTDTSVCIGCKACEVACKEWNEIPARVPVSGSASVADRVALSGSASVAGAGLDLLGMSFDNTAGLTANSWRHVAFIEQPRPIGRQSPPFAATPTGPSVSAAAAAIAAGTEVNTGTNPGVPPALEPGSAARMAAGPEFLGMPGSQPPGRTGSADGRTDFRWLMMSDVCKHCTHAACLDVCPTGSLFRTEFGTVVIQEDICNGCGYCIPACPYGVIDRRHDDGRAWKCTLCYDRIGVGKTPACAQACPTESIQYGPLDELRERAQRRVERLQADGVSQARLYGHDPDDGVGGDGAFFLLLDEPEVYGLPPDPIVTTRDLPRMWWRAGLAALGMAAAVAAAFIGRSP